MNEASEDGASPPVELASTERKVRLGFGFALTCLAVVGVVAYLSVVRLNQNAASARGPIFSPSVGTTVVSG